MDREIRKLKKIVDLHLYQKKEDIRKIWGREARNSDSGVWFYSRYFWGIFRDEVAFIFEEDIVVDITIAQYFLWIEYQCVFYYENNTPEYKVFRVFNGKLKKKNI